MKHAAMFPRLLVQTLILMAGMLPLPSGPAGSAMAQPIVNGQALVERYYPDTKMLLAVTASDSLAFLSLMGSAAPALTAWNGRRTDSGADRWHLRKISTPQDLFETGLCDLASHAFHSRDVKQPSRRLLGRDGHKATVCAQLDDQALVVAVPRRREHEHPSAGCRPLRSHVVHSGP